MSSYVCLVSPKLISISCNEMDFCLAKAFYKGFLMYLFIFRDFYTYI